MSVAAAQSIGRTLARIGRLADGPAAAADDAATSSRESIYDLLERTPQGLTIEQICQLTGRHANTVRAHLEVLLAAGRVQREQGIPRGPGRPPWLHRVTAGARSHRAELAEMLLDQLHDVANPDLAQLAAERWASSLRADQQPRPLPATSDDAVQEVAASLEELGFEASVDGIGDRIELRRCPYAELVAARPVICEIHAALLGELLGATGQPVGLRQLDMWVRPGVCLARLNRPDLTPARTLTPSADGRVHQQPGHVAPSTEAAIRPTGAPAAPTPHHATPPASPALLPTATAPHQSTPPTEAAIRPTGAPAAPTPHHATPPAGSAPQPTPTTPRQPAPAPRRPWT